MANFIGRYVARIHSIDFHRNGVGGIGFHVVLFDRRAGDGIPAGRMIAIIEQDVYEEPRARGSDIACYVLDVGKLAEGDIAFTSNSWRGDVFYDELWPEVVKHNEEERKRLFGEAASW